MRFPRIRFRWYAAAALLLFLYWKSTGPYASEEDVLWLARCLYSESTVPREQYLIGWVVRNRVQTRYRGRRSYREVILDPIQFSAFNRKRSRERFARLGRDAEDAHFQASLRVAERVVGEWNWRNPLPETARHFYSLRGMRGRVPPWARGRTPLDGLGVDDRRLRIFADVR